MPNKLKRNLSTPELREWWAAVERAAKSAPRLISSNGPIKERRQNKPLRKILRPAHAPDSFTTKQLIKAIDKVRKGELNE